MPDHVAVNIVNEEPAQGNGEGTVPRKRKETKERNISETVNDNKVDEESAQGNGKEKLGSSCSKAREKKPDELNDRELKEKESEIKLLHKAAMVCIHFAFWSLFFVTVLAVILIAYDEKLNLAKAEKVCSILAIWSFVALISSGVAAYMTIEIGPYSEQCIKFAPTFKKIVVVMFMMLGFGFLGVFFLITLK